MTVSSGKMICIFVSLPQVTSGWDAFSFLLSELIPGGKRHENILAQLFGAGTKIATNTQKSNATLKALKVTVQFERCFRLMEHISVIS